ncbi:MAG: hypothetical protein ABI142_05685 [Bryocella sp.]
MGSRPNTHISGEVPPPPKACWEVIERAAASSHLNRAARLREFLFYVGNKSLKDGSNNVHEQEIGAEVFGRQQHYDTSQDNIVRVNATELRKRIDAYFAAEGVNEPVVFQIPRGSYTPMFRLRPEVAEAVVDEKPEPVVAVAVPDPVVETTPRSGRMPMLLAMLATVAVAAVVLAAVSLGLWRQNHTLNAQLHPWEAEPAVAAFWQRFLDPHRQTDIVLADTSFALVEDISGESFALSDYLNHSYLQNIQSTGMSADRRADLALMVSRLNGSLGDFRVAQRIQGLDPTSKTLLVQFAREYSADSIKEHNVVLIGSQKSNPWVDLFNDQLNFTIEYDPKLKQSFIQNHNPRPGEQAMYAAPVNPYASAGYSIVAYLPNPSHTADALIIAGTDSQATDAAGEFVTSDRSLQQLLAKLPPGKIPYFEVLLKTTRLSGTPFNAEILGVRTR